MTAARPVPRGPARPPAVQYQYHVGTAMPTLLVRFRTSARLIAGTIQLQATSASPTTRTTPEPAHQASWARSSSDTMLLLDAFVPGTVGIVLDAAT